MSTIGERFHGADLQQPLQQLFSLAGTQEDKAQKAAAVAPATDK